MENLTKKIKALILMLPAMLRLASRSAAEDKTHFCPDGTYKFAERDTCDLFLDIYNPSADSRTAFCGKEKPTVIFMFGGGFISGERDTPYYRKWFRAMAENGYRVVSIDYRLGLKGVDKVGIMQVNLLDRAIHMAVEDLFSATAFLVDNSESLGIDPDNIVISGSSAGAISVLQAEYELCNRTQYANVLPSGFRYRGVISFSGAILSREGALDFARKPAPMLLMHGTEDNLVVYKQIKFFRLGFFGSDKIAERLAKYGYEYNILRFTGHGHEVAGSMYETLRYQLDFIEENIIRGTGRTVDAFIDDPAIPSGEGTSQSRKEMYGK